MLKVLLLTYLSFYLYAKTEENEELIRMRRTSCLFVARHYVHSIEATVWELLKHVDKQDQPQYLAKLYAGLGQICEDNISESEMQEFFSDNSDFQISDYFYLVEQSSLPKLLVDSSLSERQQQIADFASQFDNRYRKEDL